MTDLTEANGWINDPDFQLMPIDYHVQAVKPRAALLHTNANGVGISTPQSMFSRIQSIIAAGEEFVCPTVQIGFTACAQYRSIFWDSTTQYHAQAFCVGIETADHGSTNNPFGDIAHEPWIDYQVRMMAKFLAFCNRVGGIPLVRLDRWNGSGIDGHCASELLHDNRGIGYPNTSKYAGKQCPTGTRLAQIPAVIAAAVALTQPHPNLPQPPTTSPIFPPSNVQENDMIIIFTPGLGVHLAWAGKVLEIASMGTVATLLAAGIPHIGDIPQGMPAPDPAGLDKEDLVRFQAAWPSGVA